MNDVKCNSGPAHLAMASAKLCPCCNAEFPKTLKRRVFSSAKEEFEFKLRDSTTSSIIRKLSEDRAALLRRHHEMPPETLSCIYHRRSTSAPATRFIKERTLVTKT
jgi:hypothetical protein